MLYAFMPLCLSFLWGLFCACSWTWCIGMYLPRIMIERWGWWGFLAFAVPNVVGCSAFGYVVNTRDRSQRLMARHAPAMLCFSSITIAYHLFFIVWLFESLVHVPERDAMIPLGAAGIVFALAGVFSFLPNRDWLGLSVLIYAISLLAFWRLGTYDLQMIKWSGNQDLRLLALAVPAILFGFLLCPYLDLTFHRALQHSPSRHSFAVFGIAFTVMIVLTCALWFHQEYWASRWLPAIVMAHLLAQSAFTMGAHLREIRVSQQIQTGTLRVIALVGPLAAAPIFYVARGLSDSPRIGEFTYLAFLALYASVFPLWFALRAVRSRSTRAA